MAPKKKKKTQWHPAFCSAMKLELKDYKDHLDYINEYNLSSKPLQIDLLIVRKSKKIQIENEIGRIFRGHNIIEYKSPDDSLNEDVFMKVIGYACIYKASEKHVGDIELDDISITMVRERYPRKLFYWLKKNKFTIHEKYPGIFYIMKNADSQIQIIVSKRLSPKSQAWLTLLNDNLDIDNAKRAIRQVDGLQHKDEKEYADSVLQVAITENRRIFERMKEEGDQIMCEALKELMKPELTEATEQGSTNKLVEQISKKLAKGQELVQIADALEESVETIQQLIKEYKLI